MTLDAMQDAIEEIGHLKNALKDAEAERDSWHSRAIQADREYLHLLAKNAAPVEVLETAMETIADSGNPVLEVLHGTLSMALAHHGERGKQLLKDAPYRDRRTTHEYG